MDLIDRQAAIVALCSECQGRCVPCNHYPCNEVKALSDLPSAEPVIYCKDCCYWDKETLVHESNDFREWDAAECMMLAERDGYHEINRYTEESDFCSVAERRTDEGHDLQTGCN